MNMELVTKLKYKQAACRRREQGQQTQEDYEDKCLSMYSWGQESQSPSEVKSGEGCDGQQKGLLQVYQQQQESYRKGVPAAKWGMGPGGTEHRKGQETRCLLCLSL